MVSGRMVRGGSVSGWSGEGELQDGQGRECYTVIDFSRMAVGKNRRSYLNKQAFQTIRSLLWGTLG